MRYGWFLIACIVASSIVHPALAATTPQDGPRISAFVAGPVRTNQCEPVTLSFALTNNGEKTIYSGEPYSPNTYNLHESLWDKGYRVVPGRYMVGISTNAGEDNYPYRWGFKGYLAPGKTTIIHGNLSIPDKGKYTLTAVLLRGNNVVDPDTVKTVVVKVGACGPAFEEQSTSVSPPYTYYGEESNYGPEYTYESGGYPDVEVMPWVYQISPNLQVVEGVIVVRNNGSEVAIYPNAPLTINGGYPPMIQVPSNMFNGGAYVPPEYLSPYLGYGYGSGFGY